MMSRIAHSNAMSSNPFLVILRLLVALVLIGGTLALMGAGVAYVYFAKDLPPIPPFSAIRFGTVSEVRALHGQVLGEIFEERRYMAPREEIPDIVIKAFLAYEDERFFTHSGTDLRGVARAMWTNMMAGEIREGASTITQQLARALLLSNDRTFARKIREVIVARRIEDIYTKDQILVLYLNLVYMGHTAYGVQAASHVYFGKELKDLDLAEAATLAVIPQSPSLVNPIDDPDGTKQKRNHVFKRLVFGGVIDQATADEFSAREVSTVAGHDDLGDRAPVPASKAMSFVRPLIPKSGGLLEGGSSLTAETTIDLGMQFTARKAARNAANLLSRRQGYAGPIAQIDKDKWPIFLQNNGRWLKSAGMFPLPSKDIDLLAIVTAVDQGGADISLTEDITGRIPLALMEWAIAYTEFPTGDGRPKPSQNVSLDGRVKDAEKVLSPGDVVLVYRSELPKKRVKKGQAPQEDAGETTTWALNRFAGPEAALAAVDPRSGYLLAVVGGTDFDISQVDRTRSTRPTGSTIKPIYYSKAYDMGIAPSSMLSGAPFRQGDWTPTGDKSVDDMTLWQALTMSENAVSLRLFRMVMERIGVDGLNDWVERLGLSRPFEGHSAEALGGDQTPIDMLTAYGTFATGGISFQPILVKRVFDESGKVLVDNRSPRDATVGILDALGLEAGAPTEDSRRAITREAAWIISENLRNVAVEGTARAAVNLGKSVHGKTGTLAYDVWFIGWTRELAAVTWLGQDRHVRYLGRNKKKSQVYGANTPLPAWLIFIKEAEQGWPELVDETPPPEGIVVVKIDPQTGLLARQDGQAIPHLKGSEPTVTADSADWLDPVVETAFF